MQSLITQCPPSSRHFLPLGSAPCSRTFSICVLPFVWQTSDISNRHYFLKTLFSVKHSISNRDFIACEELLINNVLWMAEMHKYGTVLRNDTYWIRSALSYGEFRITALLPCLQITNLKSVEEVYYRGFEGKHFENHSNITSLFSFTGLGAAAPFPYGRSTTSLSQSHRTFGCTVILMTPQVLSLGRGGGPRFLVNILKKFK